MTRTLVGGFLLGAVASIPASKLKAISEPRLQRAAEMVWPPSEEEKKLVGVDPSNHLDNMPPAVLADRVARHLGHGPLDRVTKLRIQNTIHYSFGALYGGTYAAVATAFPAATAGFGTAAGTGLYLASHGSALPLLRVQAPPWRLPRAAFAWELASHLLFGAALESSRRGGARLVGDRSKRRHGRPRYPHAKTRSSE
jgi:putative membrane protein